MESEFAKTLRYTKNNILRNRWLSIATILVSSIIFTTASLFIIVSLLAQKAVKVAESQAQVQIYFQVDTPVSEISKVKDKLEKIDGVKSIDYVDQEEALKIYVGYYSDDPELLDTVSKEWLPASLEVQAETIKDLEKITDFIKKEHSVNPHIEDVQLREDVVGQLKKISKGINIGGISIISIFAVITFALVITTISFNIMTHKSEIEIMHLVGSKDESIKTPFILEGVFYTIIGSVFAASLIVIPWYVIMHLAKDTNLYFTLADTIKQLSLNFLLKFNLPFVILFYLIHIVVAGIIGLIGSSVAVTKYLNLKEK